MLYLFSCDKAGGELQPKKKYTNYHEEARNFCKSGGYNQEYYFLVDLGIHSGKNRFFVYNFDTRKTSDEKLVTHGSCDTDGLNTSKWEKVKFDNANNSHCSAKGKYKIGKRDRSGWGISNIGSTGWNRPITKRSSA